MLKIYGGDLSSPANKVRFVANYLNIAYEYVPVSIRDGENKKESYLKIHPAGKIPAMDDNGFFLFESNAIIKYLARKENSDIYPTDITEMARVDQWMDFISLHVSTAMSRVLFNRIFAPITGTPVDERSLEDGIKFLGRFLPVIEGQLSKNTFVSGNQITLADFNLVAALDPAKVAGVDLNEYPRIMSFLKEQHTRDYYIKCFAAYGEPLQKFASRTK